MVSLSSYNFLPFTDQPSAEIVCRLLANVLMYSQEMVTLNYCPITRSSYTMLIADMLEALICKSKPFETSSIESGHDRNPSLSADIPNQIRAIDHWPEFVGYLYESCPADKSYALESDAKARCRALVDRFDEGDREKHALPVDASQSIYKEYTIFEDPEHYDFTLRQTGALLANWPATADQEQVDYRNKMTYWTRALKLAQDQNAVSITWFWFDLLAVLNLLLGCPHKARSCVLD